MGRPHSPMKIRNRQQVLAILAIAAVGLLAADRLIITPLARIWKARAERIAKLKEYVSNGQALLAREPAIRQRWEHMRTNALSGEPSVAENQVFKAFERWAQESGIMISSIKPQWKKPADDFSTLECTVEATGNLTALTRFLYNIEKDPLAIRIVAMQINARDDSGEQLTLSLQVSALLLHQAKPGRA